MPDVYANITAAAPAVQEQIAAVLDLRAADPQQRAMREAYWATIEFPENARVLDVGCGPGPVERRVHAHDHRSWRRGPARAGTDR
jgi:hypothetical protein